MDDIYAVGNHRAGEVESHPAEAPPSTRRSF